jgi:DNA-binding NarL/FixJ family response regulator
MSDSSLPRRATRILLVDDHDVVREGLTALLHRATDMSVVGYAGNGENAVARANELHPDIVVMDLMMPALNGLAATQRILGERPLIHIIVLSSCHTSDHVHRALNAGARGYVTKTSVSADLIPAIRSVLAGQIFVSPAIPSKPVETQSAGRDARRSFLHLSEREHQVLRSLIKGSSSADIGRELSLSPKSVDTYRHRIMVKLGVSNRAELIRVAFEQDLTVV